MPVLCLHFYIGESSYRVDLTVAISGLLQAFRLNKPSNHSFGCSRNRRFTTYWNTFRQFLCSRNSIQLLSSLVFLLSRDRVRSVYCIHSKLLYVYITAHITITSTLLHLLSYSFYLSKQNESANEACSYVVCKRTFIETSVSWLNWNLFWQYGFRTSITVSSYN